MDLESVTLKLPRDLLSGAQRVATAREVTIGHMVRVLLKREVERQLSGKEETDRPDEGLITAMHALLGKDISDANCWTDLHERLRPHGYELRANDGGLVVYKSSCNTRVCKTSDLGFPYADLVARFGSKMSAPLPAKAGKGIMPAGRIDPTRRALISRHIAAAKSWPDLINRLAVEGMELRAIGAGLGIYVSATGRHLCNTSTVGAAFTSLIDRFGQGLPVPLQEQASQDGSL